MPRSNPERAEEAVFHVALPTPPSANNLFANVPGRGRIKTKAYENWQRAAALSVVAQVRADRRIGGPIAVMIHLPVKCRLDVDNAIKPILDALVYSRRIDDDRNVVSVAAVKDQPDDEALVTVHSVRSMREAEAA